MPPDLSDEGIKKWMNHLPEDVRLCLGEASPLTEEASQLLEEVASSSAPEIHALVKDRGTALEGMGRARRIRLMAWVVNTLMHSEEGVPEGYVPLVARAGLADLIGEDEAGDGGSGGDGTKILYEDYLSFAVTMGRRQARSIVTPQAIFDASRMVENAGMDLNAKVGR